MEITWDYCVLLGFMGDYMRFPWITWDNLGLLGITRKWSEVKSAAAHTGIKVLLQTHFIQVRGLGDLSLGLVLQMC